MTAEGRAGGWCLSKGGLSCISHLHVCHALDGRTGALPFPAASGAFPHFLAGVKGCVGTWKELVVEAGKAARGLQCGLCRYFLRSTSVFPQKVSGLPSIKYHLLTKSLSPCFRASHPLLQTECGGKMVFVTCATNQLLCVGSGSGLGRPACSLLISHSAHSQHEPNWGHGIMWVS